MTQERCYGVTKAGQRCKIKLQDGVTYCHHHTDQELSHYKNPKVQSPRVSQTKPQKKYIQREYQKGFIYIYTLRHLIADSPKKENWLQVKKLPKGTSEEANWKVFNPKKYILIKIGLTTGTVEQRLKQWESKCHHLLVCVDPLIRYEPRSLSSLFSSLKISNKQPILRHYDPENHGFYTNKNLAKIEKGVHSRLRELYGKGDIICHGCSQDHLTRRHGIHVEWFKVERKELSSVFQIIEEVCEQCNA